MFNRNIIEQNEDLKTYKEIQENNTNENYHYKNGRNKENSLEYPNNYNTNNETNSEYNFNKKIFLNSRERLNSIRLSNRNNEIKYNIPDYLFNIDLNKLPNNNKNIDISLLSSNSFVNKNKQNNSNKNEISPEKYLDDILRINEKDIHNNHNKMIIETLSSENNENQNNSLLTNSIKSSSEFDFFKKTLNKNIKDNDLNKRNNLKRLTCKNMIINTKEKDISNKFLNHDDIPIIAKTSSFMELVEKELANENLNNSHNNNNKSFDILPNTKINNIKEYSKDSSFLSEKGKINEKKSIKDRKINKEDKNERRRRIIKIINKKTENNKRSKTPDNLAFKKSNKKNIVKNKKNNYDENTPQSNFIKNPDIIEKDNCDNNIIQPYTQKKINNIINNNSITIISHFDIEENSIKKALDNNKSLSKENNNENKDRNDSIDKDITNYIDNEDYDENKKKTFQQKINELNYEINKFKEERNNINKIKKQYEKMKSKLMSDIDCLKKEKEDFDNFRKTEIEKIKIQKQKYLSDNKLIKNLKNENELLTHKIQKDKEIIDSLKSQLSQFQNKKKISNNNSHYEFQYLDKNNLNLKQILKTINKNKQKEKNEKLFRNKSALAMNYEDNKDNKIPNVKDNKKRIPTSINDTYNTNIKSNKSNINNYNINQDKSYEKSNSSKKNSNINIENYNNNKTYENNFYYKKNKHKNMKNSIPIKKNSDLNILTQEKYKEILKIINASFHKINKTENSSSPNKSNSKESNMTYDIKKNFEKKIFNKSKSNINFNNNIKIKNNSLTNISNIESIKRRLNQVNYNKNRNLSQNNNKKQSLIEDKLTLEKYDFKIPEKYKNKIYTLIKTIETDEKKINIYNDNKKEVLFPSGVRKEIFNDGYQLVYFTNGDIKQNYPDGKSVYYFNEAKTVQTTFNNGVLVFKFENNQIERHYPDGKKQILFPDGSERIILSNGYEETYSESGGVIQTNNNDNGKSIS